MKPVTRSAIVDPKLREALIDAFGTLWNAYRQLDLSDGGVSYPIFNRAMRALAVTEGDSEAIHQAWERRRKLPVAA